MVNAPDGPQIVQLSQQSLNFTVYDCRSIRCLLSPLDSCVRGLIYQSKQPCAGGCRAVRGCVRLGHFPKAQAACRQATSIPQNRLIKTKDHTSDPRWSSGAGATGHAVEDCEQGRETQQLQVQHFRRRQPHNPPPGHWKLCRRALIRYLLCITFTSKGEKPLSL